MIEVGRFKYQRSLDFNSTSDRFFSDLNHIIFTMHFHVGHVAKKKMSRSFIVGTEKIKNPFNRHTAYITTMDHCERRAQM